MTSAERRYQELLKEVAAMWYIADDFGEKIVVKTLSDSIKSLISGCEMEFLFGKNNRHVFPFFHTGLKIHDDLVHPLRLTSINRLYEEHYALQKILSIESVVIEFYTEHSVCVAAATLKISEEDRRKVTEFLGNINDLYSGSINGFVNHSLDCFDYSIGRDKVREDIEAIDVLFVKGKLDDWRIVNNTFFGIHDINSISIGDQKEGPTLEKQAWITLEGLFTTSIYINPQIKNKFKYRELTDALAFYNNGVFLVESKALTVLNTSREMNKKVSRIQKHVSQAIDQLSGAAKKIAAEVEVFSPTGNLLQFRRDIVPHCIVLVSELLPFGDWTEIENKIIDAMDNQEMFLNVLDLREFVTYVALANHSRDSLNRSLKDRVTQFRQFKSIHMRVSRENPSQEL